MKLYKAQNVLKLLSICLLIFSITRVPVAIASSSGYLDALEAEAGNAPAARVQEEETHREVKLNGQNYDLSTLEGFESYLKTSYFGSYVFYQKLSDKEKDAVYKEFLAKQDVEAMRNKIIDLLKK